ncbi:MAG: hypothetical protein V3V10_09580, partial [Planctomycetota bacterium]
NMKITVEGVETIEQVNLLSNVSCHQLQGYYFAKPLQKKNLPAYLLKQQQRSLQNSSKSPNASIHATADETLLPPTPIKHVS